MNTIKINYQGENNATPLIVEAVNKIKKGEANEIIFEKGVYHCFMEGTIERYYNATYLEEGIKKIICLLENVENLTIDGQGAEMMVEDRIFPFFIKSCKNITIKNLTLDFSFPRYSECIITQSDETGFTGKWDRDVFKIEVDDKGHIRFFSKDYYSASTEDRCILMGNSIFGKAPWDYLFAGDSKRSKEGLATGYFETDARENPDGTVTFVLREGSRVPIFEVGEKMIFCYEARENVNFYIDDCENIKFDHIREYRGGGMGLVGIMTENIFINDFHDIVRPGRSDCRSTTADGFFFTQCSGDVHMKDCVISQTLDDALNIHGIYMIVDEILSDDTINLKFGLDSHKGSVLYRAGDEITISDGTTQNFLGTYKVLRVTANEDKSVITLKLDKKVEFKVGDVVENPYRMANFIFENCYVEKCPHLRVSGANKIILRNNTFNEIYAILIRDLLTFWYESGAIKDMEITNNTFINCPRYGNTYPIIIESDRVKTSDIRNENIKIIGNKFIMPNGHAIEASMTDNLVIENNTYAFEKEGDEILKISK